MPANKSSFLRSSLTALAVLFILTAGHESFAADEEFPGIKSLMNAEELKATGVERLNDAEIRALDAWLLRYTAGEADVLQESNKAVKEAKKEFSLQARLGDDFRGWDGKTIFYLDNGQVWEQRLRGFYLHRGEPNPEVRIEKNLLGFYRMTLIDGEQSVGVRRVR